MPDGTVAAGFLPATHPRRRPPHAARWPAGRSACTGEDGRAGIKRRARDSNPQPLSGHLISSQTASRSLTLHPRVYPMEPTAAIMPIISRIKIGFWPSVPAASGPRKRSIAGSCRNPVRTACAQRSDYRRGTSTSPRARCRYFPADSGYRRRPASPARYSQGGSELRSAHRPPGIPGGLLSLRYLWIA